MTADMLTVEFVEPFEHKPEPRIPGPVNVSISNRAPPENAGPGEHPCETAPGITNMSVSSGMTMVRHGLNDWHKNRILRSRTSKRTQEECLRRTDPLHWRTGPSGMKAEH